MSGYFCYRCGTLYGVMPRGHPGQERLLLCINLQCQNRWFKRLVRWTLVALVPRRRLERWFPSAPWWRNESSLCRLRDGRLKPPYEAA